MVTSEGSTVFDITIMIITITIEIIIIIIIIISITIFTEPGYHQLTLS